MSPKKLKVIKFCRTVMRKIPPFLLIVLLLFFSNQSEACLGRNLNIGILNSTNERLLAELLSVLINERTGTTINIIVYKGSKEIYNAVKTEEINIIIENTNHAMGILGWTGEGEKGNKDILKGEFRKKLNLISLRPFGFLPKEAGGGNYHYFPVIAENILKDFPALPRVINKLSGVSNDENFQKLIKSVRSGRKAKRIVRDFLKKKKLI